MKNIIKTRAVISSLLLISFLVVLISGIGLLLSPSGYIAKTTSWLFLGLTKFKLEKIHNISGFLMSALVIIHLFINYKLFITEIKTLFKK